MVLPEQGFQETPQCPMIKAYSTSRWEPLTSCRNLWYRFTPAFRHCLLLLYFFRRQLKEQSGSAPFAAQLWPARRPKGHGIFQHLLALLYKVVRNTPAKVFFCYACPGGGTVSGEQMVLHSLHGRARRAFDEGARCIVCRSDGVNIFLGDRLSRSKKWGQ